jgi:UDPglucose 6-dehydrogenase
MVDKIAALCGGDLSGRTVAVLRVTFKPNTDDTREAPPPTILPALQLAGATMCVVDP